MQELLKVDFLEQLPYHTGLSVMDDVSFSKASEVQPSRELSLGQTEASNEEIPAAHHWERGSESFRKLLCFIFLL